MKFKHWLQLNEMPHLKVNGNLSIPCPALVAAGMELPCLPGQKIGMIDMRFEFYPKGGFPWTKLMGFGAKWIALIPGSTEYLVFDNGSKLMQANQAAQEGMLSGAAGDISEKGFVRIPDDWLKYAIVLDTDYNVIKQ